MDQRSYIKNRRYVLSRTDNMIQNKNELDMQNSQYYAHTSVSRSTGNSCTGKCRDYKANKPATGGRYGSGQSRCQHCDIFLTSEGIRDNTNCKCCNRKVRTHPRKSDLKEKYFVQINDNPKSENVNISNDEDPSFKKNPSKDSPTNQTSDDDLWLEDSTKDILRDDNDNKKSTPVYEKIDESVKTYYEFKEFLKAIKLESNYLLVMLKELLQYGILHKGEIAESLAYFNNKNTLDIDTVKYYFTVPVFDILLNHDVIIESEGLLDTQYFSLNVKLDKFQKIELTEYLNDELIKYNKDHDIPENQYPIADNMGNIHWTNNNIKSNSSVQKIKNLVKKNTFNIGEI